MENEIGNPFNIICIKEYEFEGRKFKLGEISKNSWGRPIPDGWKKLSNDEYKKIIDSYKNGKK